MIKINSSVNSPSDAKIKRKELKSKTFRDGLHKCAVAWISVSCSLLDSVFSSTRAVKRGDAAISEI